MPFWELLGNIYLFLTPSKTDGRVPSQKGAPTTCNLTYWEVSQQTYVQTLLVSLGVVIGQNSPLQGGGGGAGGRGERLVKNNMWQLLKTSNPLRHPELPISQQHFPSKDIITFSHISQPAENLPVEQIF